MRSWFDRVRNSTASNSRSSELQAEHGLNHASQVVVTDRLDSHEASPQTAGNRANTRVDCCLCIPFSRRNSPPETSDLAPQIPREVALAALEGVAPQQLPPLVNVKYSVKDAVGYRESDRHSAIFNAANSARRCELLRSLDTLAANHHAPVYLPKSDAPNEIDPTQEVFFRRMADILLVSLEGQDKSLPVRLYSIASGGALFELYFIDVLIQAGYNVESIHLMDACYNPNGVRERTWQTALQERFNVSSTITTSVTQIIRNHQGEDRTRNVTKIAFGINLTGLEPPEEGGNAGRRTMHWINQFKANLGERAFYVSICDSGLKWKTANGGFDELSRYSLPSLPPYLPHQQGRLFWPILGMNSGDELLSISQNGLDPI